MRHGNQIVLAASILLVAIACAPPDDPETPAVTVYTSVDQQLAEGILQAFTAETGIPLRPVFDTEATKTTGLVNRLIAEKDAPRADVFWNSEIVRTVVLAREGVLEPYESPQASGIPSALKDADHYWTGQALRARAIMWQTGSVDTPPVDIDQLTHDEWRGKVAMAYPLFGTTGSHVAALFATRGAERTQEWLEALRDNEVQIVDGNSTARDLVTAGAIAIAFTDTDDFAVAVDRGHAVSMAFADAHGEGTFVIPATVALVRGGPNPQGGRRLVDYLLSPEVEAALVRSEGAFMPVREGAAWPQALPPRDELRPLEVDWYEVADRLHEAMTLCRDLFVRQ